MGVNNPSISVFKSFFIHKILIHPKKSGKNLKKSKKSKEMFWAFKIRTPYLGVNNPSGLRVFHFEMKCQFHWSTFLTNNVSVLCNLMCPHGKRCFRSNGHVTCERLYPRCDTHRCAHGQVCELVQVSCARSPCFPIETCLPIGQTRIQWIYCWHSFHLHFICINDRQNAVLQFLLPARNGLRGRHYRQSHLWTAVLKTFKISKFITTEWKSYTSNNKTKNVMLTLWQENTSKGLGNIRLHIQWIQMNLTEQKWNTQADNTSP